MAPRTRSAQSSPVKAQPNGQARSPELAAPLRSFILPKERSADSRIITLTPPTGGEDARFFFCPALGLYEFKKMNIPSADPRSTLFTRHADPGQAASGRLSGYINKSPETYIATPFDLVFILIPLLSGGRLTKAPAGKTLFQPLDDLLEHHLRIDRHLRYVFEHGRSWIEAAAALICDTVEAGDESMYRLNEDKILGLVLGKAENLVKRGLPASIEERFVKRALDKPVLNVKREESSVSVMAQVEDIELSETPIDASETQSSTESFTDSVTSQAVSQTTSVTTIDAAEDELVPVAVVDLLRLRTAFTFITSSYLSEHLGDCLSKRLASKTSIVDFAPLDTYLGELAKLRADALASRALSTFNNKRGFEDEDTAGARAEKKQKQDEEEKRKKAGESRGVRDLKKVNVTGMKKMSDFFAKKAPLAKAKS